MMTPRRLLSLGTALLLTAGLAGCDGANCFEPGGCGGIVPDSTVTPVVDAAAPTVTFTVPADSAVVAVGDSVFVTVRVADENQLKSLLLEGYVMRGDPNTTTPARVERFAPKSVDLSRVATGRVVRDTTINRYLVATADSLPERGIFVVATAVDSAGNSRSDTVRLSVGGPRVAIVSPAGRAEFRGNTQIPVRLLAEDANDLIRSVRLRASGAFTRDTTLTLRVPVARVDTVVVLAVPNTTAASAPLRLEATTISGSLLTGTSAPVDVVILASAADAQAPRVSFTVTAPSRAEPRDTIAVRVQADDETRVDSIGASVVAIRRTQTSADTLSVLRRVLPVTSGQVRFVVEEFATAALPFDGLDTLNIAFEVTAWAKDPAGNCGAAVSPGVIQSLGCRTISGATLADGPGLLQNVLLARGATIPPPNPGDVVADMVADGNRLFLSNLSRNRVEVLPVGATTYATPVRVGSEPWGLALGRNGDTLFVGNSGGTNISLIPLRDAGLQEAEEKRILTRNERLYSVTFDPNTQRVTSVTLFDYSDRPQFIGQASNGLLVYSTRPSEAAPDGTVRIYDGVKRREEIFTGYVARYTAGQAIVVNADSAFLVPPGLLMVCPRRPFGQTTQPGCITDFPTLVEDSLRTLRTLPRNASGGKYDTRVDIGANIEDVGLSDTTFVATSGDREYVAVGEGVVGNARIPMFRAGGDSLVLVGDVSDLISNAAERVIGLGINRDGSLGVARGNNAYFFTETLRLQGQVLSGTPSGGVAMHPGNTAYPSGPNRLAFVSGVDDQGPYVDVIDSFNFFRINRLYVRDPVVGALAVAPRAASDPAEVVIRVYALTSRGVIALRVTTQDLTRR